jgi:anti-sigma factor RsiW
MPDDDAELVALIDNELDDSNRTALLARLAADDGLRQRYEELRRTGAPLAACLDELLTQAPLARLRAALPAEEPPRLPSRRFSGLTLRDLAAGIIGILAAGAAAWVVLSLGLLRERQDWRTAVVEYTNLYTNETFSPLNPDASLQAIELSVDPSGAPVALCIIANDAPDAPMRSERRDNLSLAWWSHGGRSRLVIGRIPEERAVAFARTLEKRI